MDLVAGLLPASTAQSEPNKLGVGTSEPPKTVTPLPVAEKDQTPPPPQIAMKASKPTEMTEARIGIVMKGIQHVSGERPQRF